MFITQESPALALAKNTAAIGRSLCRECNRKKCKRKPASIAVIRGQIPGGPPHLTSRSCPGLSLVYARRRTTEMTDGGQLVLQADQNGSPPFGPANCSADLSLCRRYRYDLWRKWGDA